MFDLMSEFLSGYEQDSNIISFDKLTYVAQGNNFEWQYGVIQDQDYQVGKYNNLDNQVYISTNNYMLVVNNNKLKFSTGNECISLSFEYEIENIFSTFYLTKYKINISRYSVIIYLKNDDNFLQIFYFSNRTSYTCQNFTYRYMFKSQQLAYLPYYKQFGLVNNKFLYHYIQQLNNDSFWLCEKNNSITTKMLYNYSNSVKVKILLVITKYSVKYCGEEKNIYFFIQHNKVKCLLDKYNYKGIIKSRKFNILISEEDIVSKLKHLSKIAKEILNKFNHCFKVLQHNKCLTNTLTSL